MFNRTLSDSSTMSAVWPHMFILCKKLSPHLVLVSATQSLTQSRKKKRKEKRFRIDLDLLHQRSEVTSSRRSSAQTGLSAWHGVRLPLCLFKLSMKGFQLGRRSDSADRGRLTHKRLSERQKSPLCCSVSRYPQQFSGVLASSCGNQYILCGENDSR